MLQLALAITLAGLAQDWNLEFEKGHTRVWSRRHGTGEVREFRTESQLDHPPEQVWKLLQDPEYVSRIPYVAEYRVVKQLAPKIRMTYTRLDFPVIDDRDYFLESEIIAEGLEAEEGRFLQRFRLSSELRPARRGIVRVPVCEGHWELRPVDNGARTHATYVLRTDPGGLIPKWMADAANQRALPGVMDSLAAELDRRAAAALEARAR
ncbi:MAG: SRPBCC family protein [Myxococcales bacterium]